MTVIKNGFTDGRTVAELLASARPPDIVTYIKTKPSLPTSAKNALSSKLMRGAAKSAIAPLGAKLLNIISGKSTTLLAGNLQRLMSLVALGSRIVERLDPDTIQRPLLSGMPSVNPAQAAKSLAQTAASSVLSSLVTGVPTASGVPPARKIFKTLMALKKSPRLFSPGTSAPTSAGGGVSTSKVVGGPSSVLIAQRGLLQDELMYRLTLVAENTYAPIRDYAQSQGYPPVVVLDGFRAENSGMSPHEVGEALDITVGDGSLSHATTMYRLAQWVRDNVIYDQLVLCYGNVGGGQVWLHISFTLTTRRRQVYTKFFNDTHKSGLYLVGEYTDDAFRAADRSQALAESRLAGGVSQLLLARTAKLSPVGVNTPELTSGFMSVSGVGVGSGAAPTSAGLGGVYVANNALQTLVTTTTREMMGDPVWYSLIGFPDHDESFVREVVRRCVEMGAPSTGTGAIGLNEKRGSQGPSRDVIAILNPTGTSGFGSWDTERRVQIIDIIVGTDAPNPTGGWMDQTEESWTIGGGFIPVAGASSRPSGNIPPEGHVSMTMQLSIEQQNQSSDPFRDITDVTVDLASQRAGDSAAPSRLVEDYRRMLTVTVRAARTLSLTYPQVGIQMGSGEGTVGYPSFPDTYYANRLVLSRSGPVVEVVTESGTPRFEVIETDTIAWRSPITGSQ